MLAHFMTDAHIGQNWFILAAVGVAVLSYCLGCLNGAVTVSKFILRDDVRNYGSGNGGLTNFCRVHGGPLTVLVVLADVLKAVVSVLFAAWLANVIDPSGSLVVLAKYWAGLCCILGHMFPVSYQFRGGKGVLSGGIIAILVDWRVALVVWGGFLILAFLTKFVSLGAIWAGLTFPIATWLVFDDPLITVLGIVCGGLLLFKHRANMKRLLTRKEPKFSFKKNPPPKNHKFDIPGAEDEEGAEEPAVTEEGAAEVPEEEPAEAEPRPETEEEAEAEVEAASEQEAE